MKDLILFGAQGCGKGTQARILEGKGYTVFETGKELRSMAASGTPLGLRVKGIIEEGNLVPDEVVIEIVEAFLRKISPDQAVIFDGVPRRVSQKDLFEKAVEVFGRNPLAVLLLISDNLALKRLSNRWMSKATGKIFPSKEDGLKEFPEPDLYQRADDKPDAIKTRLATYHRETQPVIDWYLEQGRMVEVNGEQEAEKVTEQMIEKIEK